MYSILAAVQNDPVLSKLVILALVIILIGFISRLLKQPYIVAYIVAGVILGPNVSGVFVSESLITHIGTLGLVLLLFFIGMELSLPTLIKNWRVSVIGTLLQILASVFVVWLIGIYFDWQLNRIIMLGFVISLSSTAVVIKLLEDRKELNTRVGQNVIGILIAQDIFIVPMLIALTYLGGTEVKKMDMVLQTIGGLLIAGLIYWIVKKEKIKLPLQKYWKKDHEMQVFISFSLCFGFSVITALFGLSSALGAFIAGILVSSAKSSKWFHDGLHSFRVVFVALFFVSVGMLIDLEFLISHLREISLLIMAVFLTNSLINAVVIKFLGDNWKDSLYAGAMLSQIGEFSFVLASTGFYAGIITEYTYQITIAVISLSLLFSAPWITIMRKLTQSNSLTNTT